MTHLMPIKIFANKNDNNKMASTFPKTICSIVVSMLLAPATNIAFAQEEAKTNPDSTEVIQVSFQMTVLPEHYSAFPEFK